MFYILLCYYEISLNESETKHFNTEAMKSRHMNLVIQTPKNRSNPVIYGNSLFSAHSGKTETHCNATSSLRGQIL